MRRLRAHLTYANVMATVAVFIALGGTSYALTRNSVGAKQIRPGAVGASELRKRAVRSSDIKDRAIGVRDISRSARNSLRGQQGPAGPPGPAGSPGAPFAAAVNAAGKVVSSIGGAGGSHQVTGVYEVIFNRDLQACYSVASLSRVPGAPPEEPVAGEITSATTARGVTVRIVNSSGAPTDLPFHLIVVC